MPKAEWFHAALQSRSEKLWRTEKEAKLVQGNPIQEKGKMRVFLDGEEIYSKGPFNATNPQPTPKEVAVLMQDIFPSFPLSDEEAQIFTELHEAQILRGKSKH